MAPANLQPSWCLILFLSCTFQVFAADWNAQRLNQFQEQYNNSQADIIFLLDVSGSVSNYGFNTEKEFIKSLLSRISVQPTASRVAVVSFGYDIKKDLDYIDYGKLDKNKCTFSVEFQRVKHRYGRATNMKGALERGKRILDDAKLHGYKRRNVNTVVFLLTDGRWNIGGEPYTVSGNLRNRNAYDVEVFSVGVGWVSRNQLERIAGVKSNVIIARDFSEFESLATRIRGDQTERLYQTVSSSLCGIACDRNATCSCGTISGIYQCACGPGYYGSGTPGECHPCQFGRYKKFASPDPCKPCPDHSSTNVLGATHPSQCKCFTGYKGNPGLGIKCKIVECPSLPTSISNGRVENCGKKYQETCTFTCNQYHHIIGDTAQSKKLVCQSNGQWSSNNTPQCAAITCQHHSVPPHMDVKCTGNKVNDRCTYTCKSGYRRNGVASRNCQPNGQWSGSLPRCDIIQCPALRRVDNVDIAPPKCTTDKTNFDDGCAHSCKAGYKPVSGSQNRKCQADGTWSGAELICKDLTPPSITCPQDITADADEKLPTKEINFNQPSVSDNSQSLDASEVIVSQEPTSIKAPYKFPIGLTLIKFSARDQAGNSDNCTFRVEIKDREAPEFTYCPRDMEAKTKNPGDTQAEVKWDLPTYKDNSGQVTLVHSTHSPPAKFVRGPAQRVVYIIEDPSKNKKTCEFFVKIEETTCPKQEPPANGALSCNHILNFGDMCTPQCMNPYDFNGPKPFAYLCSAQATWQTIPPGYPTKWPDCTQIQTQQGMAQRIEFYYFSGNCHESISAREQIAKNFVSVLDRFLIQTGQGGCANAANGKVCKSDHVKITCGRITNPSSRKRSTKNSFTISVDIEVLSSKDPGTDKDVQDLTKAVQNVKSSSSSAASGLKVMHVSGDSIVLDRVQPVGSISGVCLDGMVYDTSASNIITKNKCVACLAGQYFDRDQRKCINCPKGTYTNSPGRLGCSACPKGTTTIGEGAKNETYCRAPCQPGTYSDTGLANCRSCTKGSYQPVLFGKRCLQCPGSTTTLRDGGRSINECGMICDKGYYSVTGVEPCLPCPKGYYQPKNGQTKCVQCANPLSTSGEGASDISQCQRINDCASNPCLNGGQCVDEVDSFRCQCASGFNGKRCEVEKNECSSNPCYGKATCVDKVNGFQCLCPLGFQGKFCSERAKVCTSSLCQNSGVCHDTPEGFACSCAAGFTGIFCERIVDECASSPCLNGGRCIDSDRGFRCQCVTGYSGERCEENVDDCAKNNLCLNGGVCVDGVNDFTCQCKPGYGGDRCDVNIDECASNPCRNGAKCVDLVNSYKCLCRPAFYGTHCQQRQARSDFDLQFNRNIQGYAETTLHEHLKQFTLAFWMKSSSDDIEAGTVLSYAVDQQGSSIDNALVVKDPNHFLFNVMGMERETGITGTDDSWHHVAITWSSINGAYAAYKDGLKMTHGSNFQTGKTIPAGGYFILGQEQDEVGRNFSAGEAFMGSLSQLNMWNTVLPESEILEMSRYRCDNVAGNIVAWADFLRSKYQVKDVRDFCTVTNTRFSDWINTGSPRNGIETQSSACPNRAKSAQCVGANDNKSIRELNLIDTTCSSNGFSCTDAAQKKHDPNNPNVCPDFKARFECPHTDNKECATSPCKNGGTCIEKMDKTGYRCVCKDGFAGKDCLQSTSCHSIKSLVHGRVSQSGSVFRFSCTSGYKLQGSSSLSCVNGRLNGALPSCADINECSSGNGGCHHRCINTKGSFKCACNKGFKLDNGRCVDIDECLINKGNCQDKCHNIHGSYRCSCRANYQLSADGRSCEDTNECKSGVHTCQQVCVNQRGGHSCACKHGYTLNSDQKTCRKISCPSLSKPSNGAIQVADNLFDSDAIYSCKAGYRLNGPRIRKCHANGQWSGKLPTCERVVCGLLGSIYNGMATKNGIYYGHRYNFNCLSGHLLIGTQQRTCQQDANWSGKMPRCVPYRCRPLSAPQNGMIVGSSLVTGASVIIKCDKGYMLNDQSSNFRTCQSDGSWSGNQPSCMVVRCKAPNPLVNGTISGTDYTYGKKIVYSCNHGSGLSGPPERTCQDNGEWSGFEPKCLWQSCGYPGVPNNGKVDGSDYSFGKRVTYSCNEGHKLIGDSVRMCLDSGRWTGSTPRCEIVNCGNPGTPTNGVKYGNQYTFGKSVSFDCNAGYSLRGSTVRSCDKTGQWSGSQPTCIGGICGSPGLVGPSGSISSPSYPNSYGLNEYCRWAIAVSSAKKASITIPSLKTEKPGDRLEIRDGASKAIISVLAGVLPVPVTYTSGSNSLDVKFVSDGKSVGAVEGFQAQYEAVSCGGHIPSFGLSIQSPGYPSNYPNDITCVWQIVVGSPIEVKFEHFNTERQDKLEVWNSITDLTENHMIGSYFDNRGSFLKITSHTGFMYLKFSSDSVASRAGFKAQIRKLVSSKGK